ncbi:endonuclease/exonuclease/phosphatase family protein [uncultured Shimia sp.]|uniref:endonuclease/exonuclease/phosphatase family protein n=3 Tax=Shimia TaxID=573139 RepID=UPI00260E6892|nr:endonuclease/exonuclease/phosphatase family protein [uncultured Shimia sp.]
MLRDILRGDLQARAVARVLAHVRPDIVVLQGIDYDAAGRGLQALRETVAEEGLLLPHQFALRPNTGMATDLDLNGDGRRGGPRDAQGYGRFSGHRGMAILSRWPIDQSEVEDFSRRLWRDMPGAQLPRWPDGRPFPSSEAQALQRLSSVGHWVVPIHIPNGGKLRFLVFHAAPPVFDGKEDRNGLRNAAEIRFWLHYLDGVFGAPVQERFVIAGVANIDPTRGTGRREAIQSLLKDPRLQDPRPLSGFAQANTVNWPEPEPGDMRASYILPSHDWKILGSGVFWPAPDAPTAELLSYKDIDASHHRIVWVDLEM